MHYTKQVLHGEDGTAEAPERKASKEKCISIGCASFSLPAVLLRQISSYARAFTTDRDAEGDVIAPGSN